MCKEIFFKQIIFITFFMMILSKICGQTDDKWRVWVKVSPCSGRFDWITVAKDNPTNGGLSFYNRADIIFPGTKCTVFGCTFAAANDVANSLKPSDVFFDYCCRDFSVWENSTTKEKSIVVGKFGTAGVGWLFIQGDLCCEEAELLAGISGACSGTSNNNNNTVRSKPDCDKYYKNSIAQWDPATNQYQCYCAQGFTWNATRTECVSTSIPDCDKYYKNSIAQWDPATNQYQCYCAQGFSWNAARTECVSISIPDCPSIYKNSIAQWDPATNQYLCYCAQGYEWNSSLNQCVLLGNGDRENPRVNAQQQKIGQCNIEYKSGANEPEQYTIDVKSNIGSVLFSYSTFTVKDRIHIYQSGTKIFDSGCIGASGSQVLKLNGSSSIFVIVVDPLCSPGETSDTAWNFTLGCPY
jgi:hypothetical protein